MGSLNPENYPIRLSGGGGVGVPAVLGGVSVVVTYLLGFGSNPNAQCSIVRGLAKCPSE